MQDIGSASVSFVVSVGIDDIVKVSASASVDFAVGVRIINIIIYLFYLYLFYIFSMFSPSR